MTKIKYDVSDVEPGQDFDKPIPTGLYSCVITECREDTSQSSGEPMIVVELEVMADTNGQKDYKGRKLWDYIVLNEASAWKLSQFVAALQLKAKGALEPTDQEGKRVRVRVKHQADSRQEVLDANNGNPIIRAKVGALLPVPSDEDVDDDDEPGNEDAEATEEATDDDEGSDDDELTYADLESYDREELEAVVEENDLEDEVSFNAKTSDEKLMERIAEALDLSSDEDEAGDDDDGETPDYSEWSVKDLKTELKSRGLSQVSKAKSPAARKKALVARLEKDDATDDDGEPF